MNAADLRQKTGPGVESLRGGHRRRLSLSSLSLGEDVNTNEGNVLGLETEIFNYNYAVICSSGSGRHKRSYSLSSNSSSSSLSSPLWSPCSSAGASQAAVPFSWEDRPGVPKHKPDACNVRELELDLPLPPSSDQQLCSARRSLRRAKKRTDDPFVTALVECTRTRQNMTDAQAGAGTGRGRQGQRYSCMRACATVDAHIAVPRKQLTHSSIKPNAHGDTAHEPLLNCALQSNNSGNVKLCRSGNTENVVATKVLREQRPLSFMQSSAWDLEFCRSLLHR